MVKNEFKYPRKSNGEFPVDKTEAVKNGKTKPRSLPEKTFQVRESLITIISEDPHIGVVKNIFVAYLVGLFLNTATHDYLENGEVKVGIGVITKGLGKIHIVAALWIILNICVILCYFCFNLWANVRIRFSPKAHNIKIWDSLWLLAITAYYILQFWLTSILVRYFELPIGSTSIVCLEQIRLLMKIHSYIRANAPRVIQFKPHSEKTLQLNNMSNFMYFLFAPTLIYRDEYPRTSTIRWHFVLDRALELVGVIFYYAFLLERFIIPAHKDIGLRPYSKKELILLMSDHFAVGVMFLLLGFYVVLHTTQNLVGELLRFGDRQFYSSWWTSTNYSRYFRTWNFVVGDWLYTYVYKEFYEFIVPGNKTIAKLTVFMISAIVHEWVLTYMFGFFLPALFLSFLFSGTVLSLLPLPKLYISNIFIWYILLFGSGLLVSLYAMEYFVRVNVPIENSSLKDFFIPRLFTCNCII